MNLKTRIGIYLSLFLGIGLWFYARGCDKKINKQVSSPVLNKGVTEKLIVNPENHTLVIVHPSGGSQTLFLPDRPSSIEIGEKGTAKLTVRQYGTEVIPTIGFAYSDTGRLSLGVNLFYLKKFDFGASLFPTVSGPFSLRIGPTVSYNVWDNFSLFLGITNRLAPIGGFSLKI